MNVPMDKTICNFIIKQLGGFDHLHLVCGFREFSALEDGLQFRVVHMPRRVTHVSVRLLPDDTYSIALFCLNRKTLEMVDKDKASGVMWEDLRPVLGRMLELGSFI